ncbi:MAG: hypothetical protein V4713_00735 [Pseudomonadota bacterium]
MPTAWLKADDGLLVLDRNLSGKTYSGKELFSNASVAVSLGGFAEGIKGHGMAWEALKIAWLNLMRHI